MPFNLVRYQQTGHLHFVTFTRYRRQQHLGLPAARGCLNVRWNRCVSRRCPRLRWCKATVEESMPQGLKPRFVVVCNVWAKAQTYLEAKAGTG